MADSSVGINLPVATIGKRKDTAALVLVCCQHLECGGRNVVHRTDPGYALN
jgi:hypothetical protein